MARYLDTHLLLAAVIYSDCGCKPYESTAPSHLLTQPGQTEGCCRSAEIQGLQPITAAAMINCHGFGAQLAQASYSYHDARRGSGRLRITAPEAAVDLQASRQGGFQSECKHWFTHHSNRHSGNIQQLSGLKYLKCLGKTLHMPSAPRCGWLHSGCGDIQHGVTNQPIQLE